MDKRVFYFAAVLIGLVAGLRTMTAPAAVSWAAYLGIVDLTSTWLFFLGYLGTAIVFTTLALGELVADKLPRMPSRKTPFPLISRLASGAICGAALAGASIGGLLVGGLASLAGSFAGFSVRTRLARFLGRDLPAALFEDVATVLGALIVVVVLL